LTSEAVCNRNSTFESCARAERGDGRATTGDQRAPGRPGALDRYGFDFLDKLIERDGSTPIEQLAGKLLRPGT
jgi:hypothetical protein